MVPHPMSRLDPSAGSPEPLPASDLTCTLRQHVATGFPPELALDLVLNELVARAADATQASAAALALVRGDEMICRAATGPDAPELGVRFDTREGLSGACVRTRQSQLSNDTEADSRVEAAVSRRLGIRSMLIAPVFEAETSTTGAEPPLTGLLEVFSPLPNAFNESAQTSLEEFARECERIRQAAAQLPDPHLAAESLPSNTEPPAPETTSPAPDAEPSAPSAELLAPSAELPAPNLDLLAPVTDLGPPRASPDGSLPMIPQTRQAYRVWTLILEALVIVAAVVVSFMIGIRIGWLRVPESASGIRPTPPISVNSAAPAPAPSSVATASSTAPASTSVPPLTRLGSQTVSKPPTKPATNQQASSPDELVIYENGRVIFRTKPVPANSGAAPANAGAISGESARPSHAVSAPTAGSDHAASAQSPAPSHVTASGQAATPGRAAAPRQSASSVVRAPGTEAASSRAVWLAPSQAESRLLTRVEPQYPAEASAAHRSGDVVLEVHVSQDGTISAIRTLSGDPVLAAAATEAVRRWRYQPYSVQGRPAEFQTDVTLKFSLPN